MLSPLMIAATLFSPSAFAAEWSTVSVTTSLCSDQASEARGCATDVVEVFTIDRDGHYVISSDASSGQLTEEDLRELDTHVAAVQDEAHGRASCQATEATPFGFVLGLTFEDDQPAQVLETKPFDAQVCTSGDSGRVGDLFSLLADLRDAYG